MAARPPRRAGGGASRPEGTSGARDAAQRPHLQLTDPRALRALAHPARAAVLDLVFLGGDWTASRLAAHTGLTPSAMSYHLRLLERYGFLERGESGDGRERPWRATGRGFSWAGDTESNAVTDTVVRGYLGRLADDLAAWRDVEPPEGEPWHDTSTVTRGFPALTEDEVREVNRRLEDLFTPFVSREPPAGARRVAYLFATAPLATQPPAPDADPGTGTDSDAAGG